MKGYILCEMNVPFRHRFGSGRRGSFGLLQFNFGRPCSFETVDFDFEPHFGRPEYRRHGHRSCCEESSPERECGRGRRGYRSPGCHERGFEGPRHGHEHHRGPHREGPPRRPRGPSDCPEPPGPSGYYGGDFCRPPPGPHGSSGWHGPGHYGGPHWGGWSSARDPHGPNQPGPYGLPSCPRHHCGTHCRGPPPCFGDWCPPFGPQCCPQERSEGHQGYNKRPCCRQGRKPRGPNEESSGEPCRRRSRRASPRGECSRDSNRSPERNGRQETHRQSRSNSHCGPSSEFVSEVTGNRANEVEELNVNNALAIIDDNNQVDNNPGFSSV